MLETACFGIVRRYEKTSGFVKVIYPSKLVIFDEPFTGLDVETKKEVISYLLQNQKGRIYIIATHGESDAQMLGAKRVELANISENDGGEF